MSDFERGHVVRVTGRATLKGMKGMVMQVHEGDFGRTWLDVELENDKTYRLRESDVKRVIVNKGTKAKP